ncbi:GTP cyclohydrolase, FolE2/MptA family, partial [Thiomonas arsenitoxydans]|uniref:GTP cyclohydrolase, FolE2/MptA family n=1 Tax=Thiomonas arsenitoxydans (strain DSM 22701 / CIP 110005 / 3As) TaxID=426114 RepID=UPI0023F19330
IPAAVRSTTIAETAVRQKLFEKEGITAELTIYRSGAEAFEGLAAGAADIILDPPSLVSAGRKKGVMSKLVANAAMGSFGWQLMVPVKSLCPCSKEISDYGAHNQRSHITITAELLQPVALEELIRIAEEEASCEIWGLLKRPDEKYVTEHAYENPKFVEDLVRDVAARLNADPRIGHYVAEAENFESIHNHSAYALIERV